MYRMRPLPCPPPPSTRFFNLSARCQKNREAFGIRFEWHEGDLWLATWSFRIAPQRSRSDGIGSKEASGQFGVADGFPGCPYCRAAAIVHCECGLLNCWNGTSQTMSCGWCRHKVTMSGPTTDLRISGGLS